MATLERGEEKLKFDELMRHYDQDDISGSCSEKAESPVTPNISRSTSAAAAASIPPATGGGGGNSSVDEKRMRREIANSNERRRMQSINAGFQSLRALLPHHEGEKLSKAAILQQTAEYVYQLEQERTQLLSQNCQLKRIIGEQEGERTFGSSPSSPISASKKRKLIDISDEDDTSAEDILALKDELEQERTMRIHLEEKLQRLESLYPIEKIHENLATEHITLTFKDEKEDVDEETVLHALENGHELPCSETITVIGGGDDSGGNSPRDLKSDVARLTTTSVILQPVVAEETTLISPTVLHGHQFTASNVLVNRPVCSSPPAPLIKMKSKSAAVEVERIPSPTSVSLVTTVASTRLSNVAVAAAATTCSSTSPSSAATVAFSPSPSTMSEKIITSPSSIYVSSTSRPNLETIVEAIRHLEGDTDSLFDTTTGASKPKLTNQEVPLALTKRNSHALLQVDMNPFLRFDTRQSNRMDGGSPIVTLSAEQQQRPGVIVVKQQT